MSSPPAERGAYGFRLRGVDRARDLLVDVPADWPQLEIACRVEDRPPPGHECVGAARAELVLQAGGSVLVERDGAGARAEYTMAQRPADSELVHPYLATAAAIASRWRGQESFHAGAVVIGDGAWAIVGDKEAGKSSMLAWLALAGHSVVCDDLLVLDGPSALVGPRSIDLRESAAQRLGVGEPLGRVGLRDRWRFALGPTAPAIALRGWIVVGWHDGDPALIPIRGAGRLQAIAPHRAVRLLPADPAALVTLSGLPCYALLRRREWSSIEESAGLLLSGLWERA